MNLHDILKITTHNTKIEITEVDDYWNIWCVFCGKTLEAKMREDLQERIVLNITATKKGFLKIDIL